MVIIVPSAELAPVSAPGDDCDAAPPGAAKENCPLLFAPELDIAGSMLTVAVAVSHKLVTSERLPADNLRVDINLPNVKCRS